MFVEANKPAGDGSTIAAAPGASSYVMRISLTAALAGFIFGFDTVVISGADKPIQELWHTHHSFMGFLS